MMGVTCSTTCLLSVISVSLLYFVYDRSAQQELSHSVTVCFAVVSETTGDLFELLSNSYASSTM